MKDSLKGLFEQMASGEAGEVFRSWIRNKTREVYAPCKHAP